jgi:hypothetical protein
MKNRKRLMHPLVKKVWILTQTNHFIWVFVLVFWIIYLESMASTLLWHYGIILCALQMNLPSLLVPHSLPLLTHMDIKRSINFTFSITLTFTNIFWILFQNLHVSFTIFLNLFLTYSLKTFFQRGPK